jgi:uncharacterized HAD superfamily protein
MLNERERHYHLIQTRQLNLLKAYENENFREALSIREHLDWLIPKLNTMDRELTAYMRKYENILRKFIK